MKILITGGAGFVGSNLALKLKQDFPESEITCLDNLRRKGSELNVPRLKEKGIVFLNGDVRNKKDLDLKFDIMIECSAEPSVLAGFNESPDYVVDTNLVGLLNCLEAVRKNNGKIIFLSTSRIYPLENLKKIKLSDSETRFNIYEKQEIRGISSKGLSENFPLEGIRSLYGSTKLAGELIMQEYLEMYNIQGIINRCGVIAGPWQMGKIDQGIISLWIAKHLYGGQLNYVGFQGSGKQVRDILHIDDLYDLIRIQINDFSKYNKKIYNVGGGIENSISLRELTKICEEIIGKKLEIGKDLNSRPADIPLYVTDNSLIIKDSGWKPRRNVFQTVKETYEWMLQNKEILKNILA
jgi:CDP-paratose 2-epimerase